jgi:hypothetical protein
VVAIQTSNIKTQQSEVRTFTDSFFAIFEMQLLRVAACMNSVEDGLFMLQLLLKREVGYRQVSYAEVRVI